MLGPSPRARVSSSRSEADVAGGVSVLIGWRAARTEASPFDIAVALVAAGAARPARSAGGLLETRVESFRRRDEEAGWTDEQGEDERDERHDDGLRRAHPDGRE